MLDNMEYLQHDYILTWTAYMYDPINVINVYPVMNEVVVFIKIDEKNEML